MTFFNETPFAAEVFEQYNLQGRMNGVVAVRGSFAVQPDASLAPTDDQACFVWEDTYAGDPLTTPLIRVGDLIPFKPGTDVTFLGSSFAPGGRPQPSWSCELALEGHFRKALRVTGPRQWVPQVRVRHSLFGQPKEPVFDGWRLSEPEPARETPMCWSQAFGGGYALSDAVDAERVTHPDNWIGVGWLDEGRSLVTDPPPAPRIEHPDDPIRSWRQDSHVPQGLAPIPPFWEVRRRHAGTMDEAWLAERHPLSPTDFDFRFWQSAAADCVVERWLKGGEAITLRNLHVQHSLLTVRLPRIAFQARLVRRRQPDQIHRAVLDGVHFDFRDEQDQVFLTWRSGFAWPDGEGDVILDGGVDAG